MATDLAVPLSPSLKRNDSFKSLFFISSGLAFLTCFSIFSYISSTSKLLNPPQIQDPTVTHLAIKQPVQFYSIAEVVVSPPAAGGQVNSYDHQAAHQINIDREEPAEVDVGVGGEASRFSGNQQGGKQGNNVDHESFDVYHDRDLFMQEYHEMNKTLKIFIYPPKPNDPFRNLLLPERDEPGGNYASESYFKKNMFTSHFVTKNPSEADLFYLPFSIATLRHDRRIGVGGIQGFVRDYIYNISHEYPYWNRSGGADHFYVACHSVGRTAMEKAVHVKTNAIQVVCSASYFLGGYVSHKDASIPQIWPRKGKPPTRSPSKRKKLAFYAGAMNSRERKFLIQMWEKDTEISVHKSRLKTPYSEALLGSKFCLHAKGFEVNTARIGDALYYGCVPVVLADYYDLPFSDILKWESFSVVMTSADIPALKRILAEEVSSTAGRYLRLQRNVVEVQKHFQWHQVPEDYDAFYMAMFQLWLRRSHLRLEI